MMLVAIATLRLQKRAFNIMLSADNVPMPVKSSLTLNFLPPRQNHGVFVRRKESV